MNKDLILKILFENRTKILSYGVNKIGLFGSFIRNENNENSDVDFLVEFKKENKTYDNFINLIFFLEELLQKKVEVLTPESISPYFKPYILKEVEYIALTN